MGAKFKRRKAGSRLCFAGPRGANLGAKWHTRHRCEGSAVKLPYLQIHEHSSHCFIFTLTQLWQRIEQTLSYRSDARESFTISATIHRTIEASEITLLLSQSGSKSWTQAPRLIPGE